MLQASLIVVGGEATDHEIRLELPATIGRGREASVLVQHSLVSRLHCELFERDGRLFVRDLQSLNGTYVNNFRIAEEEPLLPDQLLTLGNITFRAKYALAEQPASSCPAARNGAHAGATHVPGEPAASPIAQTVAARHASRPERVATAADLARTVAQPSRENAASVFGVPDLGLNPEKAVSASALHDLPASGHAVSFVGGIEAAEAPPRREIDTDEIDLGQAAAVKADGVRPDESALLNFIRRQPR